MRSEEAGAALAFQRIWNAGNQECGGCSRGRGPRQSGWAHAETRRRKGRRIGGGESGTQEIGNAAVPRRREAQSFSWIGNVECGKTGTAEADTAAHKSLARIGPAVTLPGREPRTLVSAATAKAEPSCVLAPQSTPQRSTQLSSRGISPVPKYSTGLR